MFLPRLIRSLVAFCDTESSRYALGSILFFTHQSGRHRMQASDGRFAADISWRDEGEPFHCATEGFDGIHQSPWLFSAKTLRKIPDSAFKAAARLCKEGMVRWNGGSLALEKCEGRFPRLDDVFPGHSRGEEGNYSQVVVNAEKLAAICKLHVDADTSRLKDTAPQLCLWVHATDPGKPMYTSSVAGRTTVVRTVLMPMASESPDGRQKFPTDMTADPVDAQAEKPKDVSSPAPMATPAAGPIAAADNEDEDAAAEDSDDDAQDETNSRDEDADAPGAEDFTFAAVDGGSIS